MLEAPIELDQGLSGKWFDVRLQRHLFQSIKQAIKFGFGFVNFTHRSLADYGDEFKIAHLNAGLLDAMCFEETVVVSDMQDEGFWKIAKNLRIETLQISWG